MKPNFRRLYCLSLILIFAAQGCAKVRGTPESGPTGSIEEQPTLMDNWVRPSDGMEMVYVPGGMLQMGSNVDQIDFAKSLCEQHPDAYGKCASETFEAEAPQHAVTVDNFWIDQTEVTNAQYRLCVDAGNCTPSRLADNSTYNADEFPVAGIPWQDAMGYCSWVGGRLATEAEWEFAARGPEGTIYPWGDMFDCEMGNFDEDCTPCDDGYSAPSPVGQFPAGVSWCGALDMAGNVWEWVSDDFREYQDEEFPEPSTTGAGGMKILRGGSWGYCPAFVRSTYRYAVPPTADYLAVGFRCVVQSVE